MLTSDDKELVEIGIDYTLQAYYWRKHYTKHGPLGGDKLVGTCNDECYYYTQWLKCGKQAYDRAIARVKLMEDNDEYFESMVKRQEAYQMQEREVQSLFHPE